MRILRTILYTILLVVGIVLASVNMTPVKFWYLPPFEFMPRPEGASMDIPLALLMLGALVFGTLIAGAGTFVEHARLRFAVRRQAKVNGKLRADAERVAGEAEQARALAEQARADADARQIELTAALSRAEKAEADAARLKNDLNRARMHLDDGDDLVALPDATPAQ